jgi:hypothetical protein
MRVSFIHVLLFIVIFLLSCDESLPPRQNPTDLFSAQVQAYYNYTSTANNVVINLQAVNNFDETLYDLAGVGGSVVITSARDSSVHKTIPLTLANLIRGNYNPVKGTLTIDPGDTVVVQVVWDFTDDSGNDLTNNDFFHYDIDVTCMQRVVSRPENFSVVAKSKLYAKLGYAQSQTSFVIRQYDKFVGPHDCAPL